MFRPLVGVPSYSYDRVLDETYPPGFLMGEAYVRRLEAAGAAPVIVPLLQGEAALRAIYERLDGVLLAGGGDVAPSCYGEPDHPKLGSVDEARDRVELTLTRWALEDRLPILAICRGIQVLNVAGGGTLYQDIEAQISGAVQHEYHRKRPRTYRAHGVVIEPGSRLAELVGVHEASVNSLHHQAVKEVAPGFRVTARAEDGVIEGIEYLADHFAVGVQWHPEALAGEDPAQQRLFDGFVHEVRRGR